MQQSAVRATWGASLGDAIARQVTIDELTAVLTILVPVPGGGFIIGALENWVFGQTADVLADRLEKSVQKEFGPVGRRRSRSASGPRSWLSWRFRADPPK